MLLTCCEPMKSLAKVKVFYLRFLFSKALYFLNKKTKTFVKRKLRRNSTLFPTEHRLLHADSHSGDRINEEVIKLLISIEKK